MRNFLIVIATLLGLAGLVWAYWPSEFIAGFATYNAGTAAYDNGDLDTAIADYTKAIKLEPDVAPAYYNRGLGIVARSSTT